MTPPNDPVYRPGDQAIARILRRAAELQESDREREAQAPSVLQGLTLAELKQLAGEVGIEPRYVEAAAAEQQRENARRKQFHFWGAPVSTEVERLVEAPLTPDDWEELVTRIRRATGEVGQSGTLGASLEWTGTMDHIRITSQARQTRIQVLSRYLRFIAPVFAPAVPLSIILTTAIMLGHTLPPLEAAGLSLAAVGSLFGAARSLAGALFRRHDRKLHRLLQELADHLAQTNASVTAQTTLERPQVASAETGRPVATPAAALELARGEDSPITAVEGQLGA